MNIVIIGTGYVGLVTGVGLASLGNNVTFIDLDEDKINKLKNKNLPFYEPGLDQYFQDDETFVRMQFVNNYSDINWEDKEIVFICVQTPNNLQTNSVDTKFLESAINEVNNIENKDLIITVKSTIPPYEIEKICNNVGLDTDSLTFNPEFLREGTAVEDFFNPDRIVIGSNNSKKIEKLKDLYKDFKAEIIITDPISSQLIKYLANTYLPLRLSFVNEAARLVNSSGGNLEDVLKGVGMDSRIGEQYFRPSPAWGGSCFPKDVVEVNNFYNPEEVNLPLIANIIESNKIQTKWTTNMLKSIHDEKKLTGIILVGAAFKEDTDDLRNSPTLDIYSQLKDENINTKIYDELIKSDDYLSLEDFEKLESPYLIALMYPVKENLMSKINNIVTATSSFLYTPWQI
jgi:UDPglucose 6-dehydrogenase